MNGLLLLLACARLHAHGMSVGAGQSALPATCPAWLGFLLSLHTPLLLLLLGAVGVVLFASLLLRPRWLQLGLLAGGLLAVLLLLQRLAQLFP